MRIKIYKIFIMILFIHHIFNSYTLKANDDNKLLNIRIEQIKTSIEMERDLTKVFSKVKQYVNQKSFTRDDIEIIDNVLQYITYKHFKDPNTHQKLYILTTKAIETLKKLKNNDFNNISEENKKDLSYVLDEYLQSYRTRNIQQLFSIIEKDSSKLSEIQNIILDYLIIPYMLNNKKFITVDDITSSKIGISLKYLSLEKNGTQFFKNVYDLRLKTLKRLVELKIENLSFYVNEYFLCKIDEEYVQELEDPETIQYLQNLFLDYCMFPWIEKNNRLPIGKDFLNAEKQINFSKLIKKYNHQNGLFDSLEDLKYKIYKRAIELNIIDKYPFLNEDLSININNKLSTVDKNLPETNKIIQQLVIDIYLLPWILENRRFPSSKNFGIGKNKVGIPYQKLWIESGYNNAIFSSREECISAVKKRIKELGLEEQFYFLNTETFSNDFSKQELKNSTTKEELQKNFIENHLFSFINEGSRYNGYSFPKITKHLKIDSIHIGKLVKELNPTNNDYLFESIDEIKEKAFDIWFKSEENTLIYPNINPIIFLTDNLLKNKDTRLWAQDYYIKTVIIPFIIKEHIYPNTETKLYKYRSQLFLSTEVLVSSSEKLGLFDSIDHFILRTKEYIINNYIMSWIEKNKRFPDVDDFGYRYNQINLDFTIIKSIFNYSFDLEQYIKKHYCISAFMNDN